MIIAACDHSAHHLPSVHQRQGMVLEEATANDQQKQCSDDLQAIGAVDVRLAGHRLCARGGHRSLGVASSPRTQRLKGFSSDAIIVCEPVRLETVHHGLGTRSHRTYCVPGKAQSTLMPCRILHLAYLVGKCWLQSPCTGLGERSCAIDLRGSGYWPPSRSGHALARVVIMFASATT